ncbi:MAG: hypothetical protein ACQEWE_11655 [Bacillota bacterium]
MGTKDTRKLVGEKYGLLEVISFAGREKGKYLWEVVCACPNKTRKKVREDALVSGKTKSCGCRAPNANGPRKSKVPREDLTGKKFGRLEVLGFSHWGEHKKRRRPYWFCKCTCLLENEEFPVRGDCLKSGNTKSCGCLSKENKSGGRKPQDRPLEDLTGKKFGLLLVEEFAFKEDRRSYWQCTCNCGSEPVVRHDHLKVGWTKSCGCLPKKNLGPAPMEDREVKLLQELFRNYRKDGIEIEYERYIILAKSACHYCKGYTSRKEKYSGKTFEINGIDRINSNLGYTINNVVPCCKICNSMKNQNSLDEFVDWIFRVNRFQGQIGNEIALACLQSCKKSKLDYKRLLKKKIYTHRYDAKRKQRINELELKDFEKLILGACHYCGFYSVVTKDGINVNGVDRYDNKEGYTLENSVSCCKTCNLSKNNLRVQDFLAHTFALQSFALNYKQSGE